MTVARRCRIVLPTKTDAYLKVLYQVLDRKMFLAELAAADAYVSAKMKELGEKKFCDAGRQSLEKISE